ncbi:MAG: hypothetical protein QMC89_04415 [Candidatus Hodarchaeaceae archaeon]|nr:hypothetical protein [Candidatus Hodarchaeaceae archaeon]
MKVDQQAFREFVQGRLKERVIEERVVEDLPDGKLILKTSQGELLFYEEEKSLVEASGIRTIKTSSHQCTCGNLILMEDIKSGNVRACWNCAGLICSKCWREWKGFRVCEKCIVDLFDFESPQKVIARKKAEEEKRRIVRDVRMLEDLMKKRSTCLKEGLVLKYEIWDDEPWHKVPHWKETWRIKKIVGDKLFVELDENGKIEDVQKRVSDFHPWLSPRSLAEPIPVRKMLSPAFI